MLEIALIVGFVTILLVALRPRPAFEILVVDGTATVERGRPPGGFVEDVEHICRDLAAPRVIVRGNRGPAGVRITVRSTDVTPAEVQRFRNAWSVHAHRRRT